MRILLLIISIFVCVYCTAQDKVTTKVRCYFLKENLDLTQVFKTTVGETKQGFIPANKELIVLGLDTINYIFYKVQYKDKIGYVHKDVIVDRYLINNIDPNIRNEYRKYVNDHSIVIGMTKYELIASLGNPIKTNTTVTGSGKSEQLVYGDVINHYYAIGFTLQNYQTTSNEKYIYIDNDIVTSFQY